MLCVPPERANRSHGVSRSWSNWALVAIWMVAMPLHAADTAAVLARAKAASGGDRWNAVGGIEMRGRLVASGLAGDVTEWQDPHTGRWASRGQLGQLQLAEGYDGTSSWQRDPGGEVSRITGASEQAHARTEAWLVARGYWFPTRWPAQLGAAESRPEDGRRYEVIRATPRDGVAVELWFDQASGLLVRTRMRQGLDMRTTRYADWRTVDGVRLPFRRVEDRGDPRTVQRLTLREVAIHRPVRDALYAAPSMDDSVRIDNARGVATVPLQVINNHLFVDARINGQPVHLLVDTGGFNLLTPAAARRLGLATEGRMRGRGAGQKQTDVALARADTLRLGDALMEKPVLYVIDLGRLDQVEGVRVDGLVGYELFRRFGVTIDYAARTLTLVRPDRFQPPAGAAMLPFTLDERIPLVHGTLDGVPMRVSIDTGSRSTVTLHTPFARRHDLVARYHAAAEAVVGWGIGGASYGRPARLGRLDLGGIPLDGLVGDIYVRDSGAFADPDIDANVGGGLLRRFTVAFDYARSRMYLKPNADARRPDDYDRCGCWLLADGDRLEVAAVTGAAAAAGLAVGDRITAIGGEPVGRRSLDAWRQRLRELPAGTRLRVDYRRGGRAATLELVLADRVPPPR